jgi:epoxyqueuosine reductase
MTPLAKSLLIKRLAQEVGFDRVGVVSAARVQHADYYRDWLAHGYGGTMSYLVRGAATRVNPAELLPGARSVICTALSYKRPEAEPNNSGGSLAPDARPVGRVARYARGADYHRIIRGLLDTLVAQLRLQLAEPFDARVVVDTGPVLEKELARAAGLGWMGKNTLIMHARQGSYLFLGEVLTTLELAGDEPVTDHCGTCTRCLDACPTGAFPAPYQLDASRCISYFTIEHRGAIPAEFQTGVGEWVFGCDICQEVCPYNRKAPPGKHPALAADRVPAQLDLLELLNLRSGAYRRLVAGTAVGRATRQMLRRNAVVALGNVAPRDERACAALAQAADDANPAVQQAVAQVLAREIEQVTEAPPKAESPPSPRPASP